MNTAFVNGAFPAGRPLMPSHRFVDLAHDLKSEAPNFCAAAYIHPRYSGRLMPCADAVWCAQQVVSGRNRSEVVSNAIAAYARKFSQEAYMSRDSITSLTAITTLGVMSVRRTVLENGMGNEVAQCLRSAATVGRIAQRHAAAEVLSRYALHAAEDRCDGSILLGAVSALTEVISALRDHRSKLDGNYGPLVIGSLRSLESVVRFTGQNAVSDDAMNLLRNMIERDEVGVVRGSAMMAVSVIREKPKKLHCGPVVPFGPLPVLTEKMPV